MPLITKKNTLQLCVQYQLSSKRQPTRPQFRRWAQVGLKDSAQVTIRLVGLTEGRRLNLCYRKKDRPTKVLTFVLQDHSPLIGDIVLCAPLILKEAQLQKKLLLHHYAHLVIHALLHLQGYDHQNNTDAKKMETLEIKLLAGLGIANPYA